MITDSISPFMKKDSSHIPKSLQNFISHINKPSTSTRKLGVAGFKPSVALPVKRQNQQIFRKNAKNKKVLWASPLSNREESYSNSAENEQPAQSASFEEDELDNNIEMELDALFEPASRSKFDYNKGMLDSATDSQIQQREIAEQGVLEVRNELPKVSSIMSSTNFADAAKSRNSNGNTDVLSFNSKTSNVEKLKLQKLKNGNWVTFNDIIKADSSAFGEVGAAQSSVAKEHEAVGGNGATVVDNAQNFQKSHDIQSYSESAEFLNVKKWMEKTQEANRKLEDIRQQIVSMNNMLTKVQKEISKFMPKK